MYIHVYTCISTALVKELNTLRSTLSDQQKQIASFSAVTDDRVSSVVQQQLKTLGHVGDSSSSRWSRWS